MRHIDVISEDYENEGDWITIDRVGLDSYLDYLATGEWS